MLSNPERNREILRMRQAGTQRKEVARRFNLSPSRISLIQQRAAAHRWTGQRRVRLREEMRAVDDPERKWPVEDLLDAIGLVVVTKKRLMDHFVAGGKDLATLRELMEMCIAEPVEGSDFVRSPLLKVSGVGKIGYWSVVNGLTRMDLGNRCNREWQKTLAAVRREHRVTGATPYS